MQIIALLTFIFVALGGAMIIYRRQNRLKIPRFIVTGHGAAAVVGVLLLLAGLIESSMGGALNDWSWISAVLLASVVVGAYVLFRKLLKGKQKPVIVLYAHGLFASVSIGALCYSLVL